MLRLLFERSSFVCVLSLCEYTVTPILNGKNLYTYVYTDEYEEKINKIKVALNFSFIREKCSVKQRCPTCENVKQKKKKELSSDQKMVTFTYHVQNLI